MSDLGILRAIRDDEVMQVLDWRNHPDIRSGMYQQHIIGHSEHAAWWEKTRLQKDRHYFIYEKDGIAAGFIGITGIDQKNSRASWGFYAAPGVVKGTGSRMNFLALRYAFDELKLHRICGEVLAFNDRSVRLHKRLGFSVEGILRSHHAMDGHFVDVYVLGLLESEWRSHAPALEESLRTMAATQSAIG